MQFPLILAGSTGLTAAVLAGYGMYKGDHLHDMFRFQDDEKPAMSASSGAAAPAQGRQKRDRDPDLFGPDQPPYARLRGAVPPDAARAPAFRAPPGINRAPMSGVGRNLMPAYDFQDHYSRYYKYWLRKSGPRYYNRRFGRAISLANYRRLQRRRRGSQSSYGRKRLAVRSSGRPYQRGLLFRR